MTIGLRAGVSNDGYIQIDGVDAVKVTKQGINQPQSMGQCRVALIGGNLVLKPYKGNCISINGKSYIIPAAGVSLSSAGTAVSTAYNIYVYDSGAGVLAMEYSTTARATDASTGQEIKSGDPTRTLVCKAATPAGGGWADNNTFRFVLNWFNRIGTYVSGATSAARSWSNTTYTELDQGTRCYWLSWGDEVVMANLQAAVSNNTVGAIVITAIGFNSTTVTTGGSTLTTSTAAGYMNGNYQTPLSAVEGSNYFTFLAWANSGTGTWNVNSSAIVNM